MCFICAVNENDDNTHSNNIVFTFKHTKLYVFVVTLSTKDNQKLPKLLSKGFERTLCWNEYKTKSEIKNRSHEYRYFLESNFGDVNSFFVLRYQTQMIMQKSIKPKVIIYQKVLTSMERSFMTNPLILIQNYLKT